LFKSNNKRSKTFNTTQITKFKKKTRLANIVVKYSKFKSTINNVINERNNLKNYISTLINKFEQISFNKNKFYQVCNYYKISLKIINNKLVKIKIEQNQTIVLNRFNSNIDRYNYSLLFNINKFNQYLRQQISYSYC